MWNTDHKPELIGKLQATDFRTDSFVVVTLSEGEGVCIFRTAFWKLEGSDKFYVVYTEHCGYHTFFADNVDRISGPECLGHLLFE